MNILNKISCLRCIACGKEYPPNGVKYTCVECSNNLDYVYDYDEIRRHFKRDNLAYNKDLSVYRYLPLLPVQKAPDNASLGVGWSPLVRSDKLAELYDVRAFFIKDDTGMPSGSLKDRASELGVQHAEENACDTIVAASTGNAAASVAAVCAFYRKKAVILAPKSAPPAKLIQILQYGARLFLVDGNYDDAFDLSLQVSVKYHWYLRSTGINPVMSEGKKTVALEIAELCGWEPPDQVFVPTGDGCIIGAVYKGFYDLYKLGWIDRIPQIIAVQAEGSAAIADAIEKNQDIQAVDSKTIADSISVDYPRDGLKAVRAVRESRGFALKVSDDEILSAQLELSGSTGIFAEPAAAASFAGFIKARRNKLSSAQNRVVILATGTGLKDVASARSKLILPEAIRPDLDSFSEFFSNETVMDGWDRDPSTTKYDNSGSRGSYNSIFKIKTRR